MMKCPNNNYRQVFSDYGNITTERNPAHISQGFVAARRASNETVVAQNRYGK